MTNSKIFIQNTTKMIHLKKYIRKVKHAAPILYFVWQFCLNQWELIQYNLSFPFYWSRTYLSHQTSHRNVSGPQIFPLSQPYKFSDSLCLMYLLQDVVCYFKTTLESSALYFSSFSILLLAYDKFLIIAKNKSATEL